MKILSLIFVSSLILVSCNRTLKRTVLPEKPNIVFVFADDQCYNTVHALGNDEVITPNLDKLVENGVTFTQAFNMGAWNGAVCVASRTMLITGLPVWKAHRFQNEVLNKGKGVERTWAKLMEAQGYDTYQTGKWHVNIDASKCFNFVKHVRPGMPKDNWDHGAMVERFSNLEEGEDYRTFMPVGYNRPLSSEDNSWSPVDTAFGGFWQGGQHWSEVLRDDAIRFIDQTKKSEKPFFMYLAFNAPHDPRQAPQEYQDLYNLDQISVPENFQPLYPEREAIDNGPSLRDAALAPFPRTEYAVQVHKKEYYASISHLDAQIGSILEALEKSGKADNTYIIYTADHGLAVGEHGLFGKQNMYDHSIRSPFIIVGPGLEKGKKVNTEIYLQDAMATALHLAGSRELDSIFFQSVLPQALGEKNDSNYDGIYGGYLNCQRMIRKDGYKLILYPDIKMAKLFNMDKDPLEMHNLAELPGNTERIKTMLSDLERMQIQVGDTLNIDDIYDL